MTLFQWRDSDHSWSVLRRSALLVAVLAALWGLSACGDDPVAMNESGAIEGTVADANSQSPIEGVSVQLMEEAAAKAPRSTMTDAQGHFEFTDVQNGSYRVIVDGTAVLENPSDASRHYGSYGIDVAVDGNQRLIVDQPFFLSVLDDDNSGTVATGQAVTVTSPDLSGFSLDVAANSATFPDGSTSGDIWIVAVPADRLPGDLPSKSWPSVAVAIYPIGTTFDPPASINFPNFDSVANGTGMDFYYFDADASEFIVRGRGTAGSGVIQGETGSEIDRASWHMPICDAFQVSGHVIDGVGSPVVGADVQIMADPQDGSFRALSSARAVTGSDGRFAIDGVRACNVRVRVSQAGPSGSGTRDTGRYGRTSAAVDVGDVVLDVDTNRVLFDVSGTIARIDGSPAAGVFVSWSGGFDFVKGRDIWAETRFDGSFELTGIVGDPGARGWVNAYDEGSGRSGQFEVTVPALGQTGTTVRTDFNICTDIENLQTCGSDGSWSLSGSTLNVEFVEVECGRTEVEQVSASIDNFANGQMTVTGPFEGGGENVSINLERVSGSGSSDLNSSNLAGVYRHVTEPGGDDTFFLALFMNGSMVNIERNNSADYAESGSYVDNGTSVQISALWNSEATTDPPHSEPYELVGNTLNVGPPGDRITFTRCGSGNDINGVWSSERPEGGATVLILFQGEYCIADVLPDSQQF